MPTATSTSNRRAADDAARTAESTWDFGLGLSRDAQDVWGRSMQASMATMGSLMEMTQRMSREFFEAMLDSANQAMKMWADLIQGTAERGSERIKDAVETMSDQVKENTGQLATLGDDATGRARSAASRAS